MGEAPNAPRISPFSPLGAPPILEISSSAVTWSQNRVRILSEVSEDDFLGTRTIKSDRRIRMIASDPGYNAPIEVTQYREENNSGTILYSIRSSVSDEKNKHH